MLKVRNGRLPKAARDKLAEYQADVDAQGTYKERVARAKSRFSLRNRKNNAAFQTVKKKLTAMCNGARRCMYCEDSVADEVEHFKPKDLYPDVVFVWMNYLYACGPCNGPKNNQFSVIDPATGQRVNVTRPRGALITPPQKGDVALIDPRRENPLEFLILDLQDTFAFTPIADADTVDFKRAEYTIDVLRLNERDYLIEARENALIAYESMLSRYVQLRDEDAPNSEIARVKKGIQGAPQPTVWAEMKRQHAHHPTLADLFGKAPEALDF